MKILRFCLIVCLVLVISMGQVVSSARPRNVNFREYLEGKRDLKVYIPDVTNSCGDNKIDTKELKKNIEEALASRRSHTFEIVQDESSANIAVEIDITEYYWTLEDPVDQITGAAAVAYDAMKKEKYARMQAVFTLFDVKKNRQIWSEIIKATITDDTMTEEGSYALINERITKVFIRKLFKRAKSR